MSEQGVWIGLTHIEWAWRQGLLGYSPHAQGIAAGTDETLKAAQPEGQEPGPKDAPKPNGCRNLSGDGSRSIRRRISNAK